jgi:CBS domain-containing protein
MARFPAGTTLGPERKEDAMLVRDVMTERVFTVTRDTSLKVAATRMIEYGVSGLPVVDGEEVVVGVVSETDVLFKERVAPDRKGVVDWLVHYGEDPPLAKLEARTAGEAMMLDLSIDRLPVVDSGQLVGIVTRADLVRAFARSDDLIAQEIRDEGLLKRFWVGPSSVTLEVDQGNVVLEGRVDNGDLADSIVAFTERIPGVVSVESKLTWPKTKGRRHEQVTA